jgi:hypothetical protein
MIRIFAISSRPIPLSHFIECLLRDTYSLQNTTKKNLGILYTNSLSGVTVGIAYCLPSNKDVLQKVKAFEVPESTWIMLTHSRKTC